MRIRVFSGEAEPQLKELDALVIWFRNKEQFLLADPSTPVILGLIGWVEWQKGKSIGESLEGK